MTYEIVSMVWELGTRLKMLQVLVLGFCQENIDKPFALQVALI